MKTISWYSSKKSQRVAEVTHQQQQQQQLTSVFYSQNNSTHNSRDLLSACNKYVPWVFDTKHCLEPKKRSCPRLLMEMESLIVSPTSIVVRTPHRCEDSWPDDRVMKVWTAGWLWESWWTRSRRTPLNAKEKEQRRQGRGEKSLILGNVHSSLMHEAAMNTGSHVDGVYGNMAWCYWHSNPVGGLHLCAGR